MSFSPVSKEWWPSHSLTAEVLRDPVKRSEALVSLINDPGELQAIKEYFEEVDRHLRPSQGLGTVPRYENASFVRPQLLVTFIVDAENIKQTFIVHRNVADANSTFFKAAFESQMVEGHTQVMRLDDVETETFGLLVSWMYNHKIEEQPSFTFDNEEPGNSKDFSRQESRPNLMPLIKLWKLGQRMLIPALQNDAMQMIYSMIDGATDSHIVEVAKLTSQEEEMSSLKDLIIYKLAWTWAPEYLARLAALLPVDIVIGVTLQLKGKVYRDDKWNGGEHWNQKTAEAFFVAE